MFGLAYICMFVVLRFFQNLQNNKIKILPHAKNQSFGKSPQKETNILDSFG